MMDRIFVILERFLPFYPPNNPKNQNFEKKTKKFPEDIIILHRCTINDNHMMYGSWDIECDGQNFLSFWTVFCLEKVLTRKIKILKNSQISLEISSFYTSVPKIIIICYIVPEIWHITDVSVNFHFELFFALLPPLQPKISKFKKSEKDIWRYHDFTIVYQ